MAEKEEKNNPISEEELLKLALKKFDKIKDKLKAHRDTNELSKDTNLEEFRDHTVEQKPGEN